MRLGSAEVDLVKLSRVEVSFALMRLAPSHSVRQVQPTATAFAPAGSMYESNYFTRYIQETIKGKVGSFHSVLSRSRSLYTSV